MKTKFWLLVMAAALIVMPAAAGEALAQKKVDASKQKTQSFNLKATKVEAGRGGEDANIKSREMANTEGQEVITPPEKGGATGRGAAGVCRVHFDNRTNLKIQLYVDGNHHGMVGAMGDVITYVGSGLTRVYARADYTDGSYSYWGPTDYTCYAGQTINFRMDR